MNDLDWDLLDRYLAAQATPAERERVERWLAESPEHGELMAAFQQSLGELDRDVTDEELEEVWARVAERADLEVGVTAPARQGAPPPGPQRVRPAGWGVGMKIAAAAVLAVGGGLVARGYLTGNGEEPAVRTEQEATVPRARQTRLQLPDGSHVLLGAGSTLRWPDPFGSDVREVRLDGQAYFTVIHDERRPFRVRAADLIATDLGTEFLVRAYPEQRGAQVVVRSGTVAVRSVTTADSSRAGQVVNPGELGQLTAAGEPQVERVDTAAYFAWTTGTLVFDGTPLREALPQLSRWYDLDFALADSSLAEIPLSGRMDQTLTPSRLDLLAGSVGLEQVREGRRVTLYRRGQGPRSAR